MLAIAVFAFGRTDQAVQPVADYDIGRWRIIEASDGTMLLLDSKDGKAWVASKNSTSFSWKKTAKE